MVGIASIQVQESLDTLAKQLRQAKTATAKERFRSSTGSSKTMLPASARLLKRSGNIAARCKHGYRSTVKGDRVDVGDREAPWGCASDSAMGRSCFGIERLWEHLKADRKWTTFKTLEQLQTKVDQLLAELISEVIASITGYSFILDALSVVNTI